MTDESTDSDTDELATDVAASLDKLLGAMDIPEDAQGPMGMSPQALAQMFKHKVVGHARGNPEDTMAALAVLHMATGDVVEKHADKPVEQVASEALNND